MSNLAGDLLLHHFIVICAFIIFNGERGRERGRRRVLGGKFVFDDYLHFRLKILKRM